VKVRLAILKALVDSNIGAISWNTAEWIGSELRQQEMAYLMGRLTADKTGGAVYLAIRPAGKDTTEEVFYIDNGVAIFHVPVQAPNIGAGGDQKPRIRHEGGRLLSTFQRDGNEVLYDMWNRVTLTPEPDETKWTALWSRWDGTLVQRPWV